MITRKQLKQQGFTFVSKRNAFLKLEHCTITLIGGIMQFTRVWDNYRVLYPIEDVPRWLLIARIGLMNTGKPVPSSPSTTKTEIIDGVEHWYVQMNIAPCLVDDIPTYLFAIIP